MYKHYFAIEKKLKNQGLESSRAELIENFTNGKKNSLKELSHREYNEFILWLNRQAGNTKPTKDWRNSIEDTKRKKVISLLKTIGYIKEGGKADMERINAWCEQRGKFKKQLNKHTSAELSKLIYQAEIMYGKHVAGL